jgi:hypothetical protein
MAGNKLIEAGMFVAKMAADGTCIWFRPINSASIDSSLPVAIVARNAGTNGVWITGRFTSSLALDQLTLLAVDGLPNTFLVKLNDADGIPTAAYKFNHLMGRITPAAIDVTANGVPVLAGTVEGATEFDPNLKPAQQGAFVAAIDPDPADPYKAVVRSVVLPGGSASAVQGARATGITIRNGKIHVSGTFSGEITLPASGDIIANTSNVPFMAVFDESGPKLLSFDAFEVPGTAESYTISSFVQLAASPHGLALAGGWVQNLDLSTHDKKVDGFLPPLTPPPGVPNFDIFVAKFNPQ